MRSVSSSSLPSRETIVSKTLSELKSISVTPSPHTPGPIRTIYITKGVTYTEVVIAETVTTVTYVTINPSQPGVLITTCIPLTLTYTPCNCDHQEYPPVDMTTITSSCHACGYQGQDVVTMVVPVAACETGSVNYPHSGWTKGEAGNNRYPDQVEGHQIYTGNEADVKSQPQPTQGQQNGEGPDYGDGSPDTEAGTQGSGSKGQSKQPVNLQPSRGHQNGAGPYHENGPLGTKAPAQGPEDEAQKTANPLPTPGQQNTDRPGDDNDQSSAAIQNSPEHNNKNGPIASASQSSNAQKPSKPLPLSPNQQSFSQGLTRETSGVPASRPATQTSPSQSVPVDGQHPGISTTFATEVEVTKEAEASDSTHAFSSLEPGEASPVPSTVSSSEAYRVRIMGWSMMVVMVGMVLGL